MAAEDDFFNFFSSLAPAEQRKFMSSFGGTQENLDDQAAFTEDPYSQVPAELAGPGAPQNDLVSQLLGQMAGGAYPQYTAAGKLDPLDLSQLAQRLNFTQDLGGSMFDVAQALFAGPDAFGNSQQFAPITKYTGAAVPAEVGDDGTPRPVTKSQKMLQIAKQSGGARGFLADLIDQGNDPEAAVAALRDLVTKSATATNLTPEQTKQINDIRNTLDVWRSNDPVTGAPKAVDRKTAGWESFDEDSLRKTAQDMFEQKLTDEMDASTLEYDPETGKYYQGKTTEDSPAAKKFRDAGLPLPNETYTDPARMQSMMENVDPGGFDRRDQQTGMVDSADAQLEEMRKQLLASQLDLQGYDQKLNAISSPGAAPRQGRPPQQDQISKVQAGTDLPPGFSARTQVGAPTMGNFPNGPYQAEGNVLPPGFSIRTQPNAPTLQGVSPQGQPQVQKPRTVLDSFGNPRTTNEGAFNFDLTNQIFQNMPQTGAGVKTDKRLQQRNAVAQRKQNLASQQQWRDQYNRNYAARNNRPSSASESMADQMAGAMRVRAQTSSPLQDTMLARLLSLTSRAGI